MRSLSSFDMFDFLEDVAGFSPLSPHDVVSGAVGERGKGYGWREKGIIRSQP